MLYEVITRLWVCLSIPLHIFNHCIYVWPIVFSPVLFNSSFHVNISFAYLSSCQTALLIRIITSHKRTFIRYCNVFEYVVQYNHEKIYNNKNNSDCFYCHNGRNDSVCSIFSRYICFSIEKFCITEPRSLFAYYRNISVLC